MNKGNDSHKITIDYRGEILEYQLPYQNIIEYQEINKRVWKNSSATKVYNVSEGLFTPIKIILRGGTVYVLDASDGYIKAIANESTAISKIGPGKGNGPGEVSFPFDFDIDEAGNFILIDIEKRALIAWDTHGIPIHDYFLKRATPTTLASVGKKKSILMIVSSNFDLTEKGLFQFYNIEEEKFSLYSEFLTGTEHLPPLIGLEMAFTGRILFEDQTLIYIPKHLNHIIYISSDGEIELVRQTIDNIQLPSIASNESYGNSGLTGSSTSLSSNSEIANLDGFLIEDHLVIWSRPGNIEHGYHVFDYAEFASQTDVSLETFFFESPPERKVKYR